MTETSTTANLEPRTVESLIRNEAGEPRTYFIPAYQRGYRWSSVQVTQLLNDIREFSKRRNPQPDQFYCLQPLVLKFDESKDHFDVVDGQQRLTTLLLILKYLNERQVEEDREELFKIDYKTRPGLLNFLASPSEELSKKNADNYHLYHAIETIKKWFADKKGERGFFESTLRMNTKVIWYLLDDRDDPVKAFTRLNVGKINLTSDELIRALFLRRTGADQADAEDLRREIANAWDQIEKFLQKDAVWYFLSNKKQGRHNRINFILELVANSYPIPEEERKDEYAIFYAFNRHLTANGDGEFDERSRLKKSWQDVWDTHMTLEEWYEDRTLYHLVGFLVNEEFSIQTIRSLSENCTKNEFDHRLRQTIFEHTIGAEPPDKWQEDSIREMVNERVGELSYDRSSDRKKIRSLLLLFNVATLLDDSRSTIRFQFDSYKDEDWNIEHVKSVAPDRLESHNERVEWLQVSLNYLELEDKKKKLRERIQVFLKLTSRQALDSDFNELYSDIIAHFKESVDEKPDHGVANLVLLDEKTNKSYKNAVFKIKRHRILSLDRAGIFVPICTRNVFLKCYGDRPKQLLFWDEEDRESYERAMCETLIRFFLASEDQT